MVDIFVFNYANQEQYTFNTTRHFLQPSQVQIRETRILTSDRHAPKAPQQTSGRLILKLG